MFFELHNGKVTVTEQGLLNKDIRMLYDADHTKGKDKFNKMGAYIYSMYDKRSIYINMSIPDRQKLVSVDVVEEEGYWQRIEKSPTVRSIVEKQDQIQFSHKERLLEGCKLKIDEYIEHFNLMKITTKNEKDYRNMCKGCEDLIDYFDKLEQKVNKEALSRQVGGGSSKMFEDQ